MTYTFITVQNSCPVTSPIRLWVKRLQQPYSTVMLIPASPAGRKNSQTFQLSSQRCAPLSRKQANTHLLRKLFGCILNQCNVSSLHYNNTAVRSLHHLQFCCNSKYCKYILVLNVRFCLKIFRLQPVILMPVQVKIVKKKSRATPDNFLRLK